MKVPQINPLGLVVGDHSHDAMMVMARNANGDDCFIEEVERGLACNCFCVECGTPVIARQGPVNEWSFAHHHTTECTGGIETQAHRFGKAVINEAGGLYVASAQPDGWGKLHPDFMEIAPVRIEERVANMRADLVGSLRGRDLIIEIKVTHGCPIEKIKAYERLNVSVLEIDLARFRYKTADELREAVLKQAPRYWHCLRGGREVPRRREHGKLDAGGKKGGLARPKHISSRQWDDMSTLEKLHAVDPDGRFTIKSRGYGR